MKKNLLDSFLDLECPIHGTKLKISHNTLFCKEKGIGGTCGNWNIDRIEIDLTITNFSRKRLLRLKKYYEEKTA